MTYGARWINYHPGASFLPISVRVLLFDGYRACNEEIGLRFEARCESAKSCHRRLEMGGVRLSHGGLRVEHRSVILDAVARHRGVRRIQFDADEVSTVP